MDIITTLRLTAFLLVATSAAAGPRATAEDARNIRHVLILESSDLHSHVGTGPEEGDWLLLADLIDKERKKAGGASNTLLVDCGDTLPGTIAGILSRGELAVEIMNGLKYDAWIPGNHDFELGPKRLLEVIGELHPATLAANLNLLGKPVTPWKLFKKNGAEIAVIGMTSPYLSKWLWGDNMEGVALTDMFDTLDKVMPEVAKAKPDMTILAIHQGRFPPARLDGTPLAKIAERYPQIDLILGGHSHQLVPGERLGKSRTWYVEPGGHGIALGWVMADIDILRHRVADIHSKLLPAKNAKPAISAMPPDTAAKIKRWLKITTQESKKIVGKVHGKISGKPRLGNLFQTAMMAKTNAEAAFSGVVDAAAVLEGDVSEADIFAALPYEDTICVLDLERGDFLRIWQEQQDRAKEQRSALYWSGVKIKRARDGTPKIILANGSEWKPDSPKRLKVAFSSYDLASGGGRFHTLTEIAAKLKRENRARDTQITMRQALRNFIAKK